MHDENFRLATNIWTRHRTGPAHFGRDTPDILKAGVYFVRDLHSTATAEGSRYLRITGTDLEMIERLLIDPETGKVERIHNRELTK